MTPVIVLSKPACVQCTATYRKLTALGVPFEVRDVTQDDEALALSKSLGYLQAPVVIAGSAHWSGYDPDRLGALVNSMA